MSHERAARKLINELRNSVPEEECREKMREILRSDCPGYEYMKMVKNGVFRLDRLNGDLPISNSFRVPMCLRRKHRPDRGMGMNRIVQFLEMKSNTATIADIVELHDKGQLPFSEEEFEEFMNSDYAKPWRRKDRSITNYSNPLSNGRTTSETIHSYMRLEYPCHPPAGSGARPYERSLLNNTWAAVDQAVKDPDQIRRTAVHLYERDTMFDVEDDAVKLDRSRVVNFNVYKQLLSSPSGSINSQILFTELHEIYKKKAPLMALLLEEVPDITRPVILQRLEQHYKSIFTAHVKKSPLFASKWEHGRVRCRALYKPEYSITHQIVDISDGEIVFPVSRTYILSKYVEYIFKHKVDEASREAVFVALRSVMSELRNHEARSVKMTMELATAVCLGARFIHELESCEIIDDANSYSVKMAVELGFTKRDQHGYERIVSLIAEWYASNQNRRSGILLEICGIMSDVNEKKIDDIVLLGQLFYRSLLILAKIVDSESDVGFINVSIRPGNISLLRTESGHRVVLNLQHLW